MTSRLIFVNIEALLNHSQFRIGMYFLGLYVGIALVYFYQHLPLSSPLIDQFPLGFLAADACLNLAIGGSIWGVQLLVLEKPNSRLLPHYRRTAFLSITLLGFILNAACLSGIWLKSPHVVANDALLFMLYLIFGLGFFVAPTWLTPSSGKIGSYYFFGVVIYLWYAVQHSVYALPVRMMPPRLIAGVGLLGLALAFRRYQLLEVRRAWIVNADRYRCPRASAYLERARALLFDHLESFSSPIAKSLAGLFGVSLFRISKGLLLDLFWVVFYLTVNIFLFNTMDLCVAGALWLTSCVFVHVVGTFRIPNAFYYLPTMRRGVWRSLALWHGMEAISAASLAGLILLVLKIIIGTLFPAKTMDHHLLAFYFGATVFPIVWVPLVVFAGQVNSLRTPLYLTGFLVVPIFFALHRQAAPWVAAGLIVEWALLLYTLKYRGEQSDFSNAAMANWDWFRVRYATKSAFK